MKNTLESVLRSRAVPSSEVVHRHPSVVPLVARLLGVVPRVFSYLEIWPPAFQSYALVVPSFFNLPFCDLGLGIGSKTRSLVAYSSSRGHGCMYCAAHSAALGNVFTGPLENLKVNADAIDGGVCQLPSARDRALVEYGMAVGRGSTSSCAREMEALHTHFTPPQIEDIVLVAATMGLLNRCLDTFGMVLERSMIEVGREHLAASGWAEEAVFQAEFDEQLFAGELSDLPRLSRWGLLRCIGGAIRFESRSLSHFPSSLRRQEAYAQKILGFCPAYLMEFRSSRARKALLHLLVDRLIADDGGLSPALRCVVGVIFAQQNHSPVLVEHMRFLVTRSGAPDEVSRLLLASQTEGADAQLSAAERACVQVAREGSGAPVELAATTVTKLSQVLSPEQIVELVLSLSIANLLLRILRSYPQGIEPTIARFAQRSTEPRP